MKYIAYYEQIKKIQGRPITSSIKPKFDYQFIADLNVCTHCEPEIVLTVLQIQTKTISHLQTLQNL